ncbi:MAG: hypothetical protein IJ375_02650 [Oscillospiraceae bacterium]|nr:hypothetical protein [Oscillospiraceae bacterium]
MEPIYQQDFYINDSCVDRYGRLKPSMMLFYAQEVAGQHCLELAVDYETLAAKRLFWAVTRHRVQITRLPMRGETIHVETWPMPTTKVAYPRSIVAYDEEGHEVFRAISIWVLMNLDTRNMILPGKSGIVVSGTVRGTELSVPRSLLPVVMKNHDRRTVRYTDLDRNGHMNNTRYLDWISDLIPSEYHSVHPLKEFTICYHSEAREGQTLDMNWEILDGPSVQVDATRVSGGESENRVFSAKVLFG